MKLLLGVLLAVVSLVFLSAVVVGTVRVVGFIWEFSRYGAIVVSCVFLLAVIITVLELAHGGK